MTHVPLYIYTLWALSGTFLFLVFEIGLNKKITVLSLLLAMTIGACAGPPLIVTTLIYFIFVHPKWFDIVIYRKKK